MRRFFQILKDERGATAVEQGLDRHQGLVDDGNGGGTDSRVGEIAAPAQRDLHQSRVVGPCIAEADEIRDHAIDGTGNAAGTVRSRS